jgi:glycosyltransferase involved in cell wall biosynthesis
MKPAVTAPPAPAAQTVAFVLVSYRPDEPAGMERAVAAMSAGLRGLGHRVLILTAAAQPRPDAGIVRLRELPVTFPCDDDTLRDAIQARQAAIARELDATLAGHQADVMVYVDGLWGLGRLAAAVRHHARRVLAVHVVGHHADLAPALAAAHRVIAPSAVVLAEASARGYDPADWRVVPNPLLVDPGQLERPDAARREQLRLHGPVRIVARLGAEKGVASLLAAATPGSRPVQVVLASAGFEAESGSQQALLGECRALAASAGADLRPALAWHQVPAFLAGAAVTIIPSARETFGNLALESLSAGTPVVAYATGNLPALLDGIAAGALVPVRAGPGGLWRAARDLLADPVRYRQACGAAYCRSRNYRSADIADAFLKAVW